MAVTTAATLTAPTMVYLKCQNGSGSSSVYLPRITAIKAGSLVITGNQAGSPARATPGQHGMVGR